MIGAIRQELLSGIRAPEQFRKLRDRLRAFSDEAVDEADYEEAATCFNRCRANGLQGSNTDFLICGVSMRRKLAVLTTDKDFAGSRGFSGSMCTRRGDSKRVPKQTRP